MAGYVKGHRYNWILTYYTIDGGCVELCFEAHAQQAYAVLEKMQEKYPDAELTVMPEYEVNC